MTRYLSFFLLARCLVSTVRAQSTSEFRSDNASYYRFADPSDITIQVKVWGAVSNPGLYEVREDISLSTLLSLAGGPTATPRETSRSSTFQIQLYRLRGEQYQLFSETLMEDELSALVQDPILLNGDMLIAEERTRQRFGWRDGASLVTVLASVVLVIDAVIAN